MAEINRQTTVHLKLLDERRNAYLSVLRAAELDLRRGRYKRSGQTEKLTEIESKWPKGDRVEMTHDAVILVALFGSDEARQLLTTWRSAAELEDYQQMQSIYEAFRAMARRELTEEPTASSDL